MNDAFGIDATVTLEKSLTVDASPREAAPRGLIFNDDGTKMYFVGGTRDKIYEYHLSTPFDINTAVNSNSHKSTSGVDTQPRSIAFQDNGKRMILAGTQTYKIWQYKLQDGGAWTPFDVSTANRDGTNGFDPSPEINDWGITWSADGTKMFVTGSADGTKVYQYGFNKGFLVGNTMEMIQLNLILNLTPQHEKLNLIQMEQRCLLLTVEVYLVKLQWCMNLSCPLVLIYQLHQKLFHKLVQRQVFQS